MKALRPRLLVVDAERSCAELLSRSFEQEGYQVWVTDNGEQAMEWLAADGADLVISELATKRLNGMDLLARIISDNPELPVIILSGYGSIPLAVQAMKLGAYHYATKPPNLSELISLAAEALNGNRAARRASGGRSRSPVMAGMVGASQWLTELKHLLARVAPTRATMLVCGETGTGKEMVARAIHANSSRRSGPWVPVCCAALPSELLESELFGHEKGAFTGAESQRAGRFEVADGGTIFLDEIGDLPAHLQVKLLRVLQEQQFERVGGTKPVKVDVRVVAATNQDLDALLAAGKFREDLYYRLQVVQIDLPPLRERLDDIPVLVDHFLRLYGGQNSKQLRQVSPEAMAMLQSYHWPGNVRELENATERAVVLSDEGQVELTTDLLPPRLRKSSLPQMRVEQAA